MPRAMNNVAAHRRHKKVLNRARGNYAGRGKLYRTAIETVHKGMAYAYRDRKVNKRNFRRLWITRITAAAKINGINYSTLIRGLKKAGVALDRKMLADIAVRDAATFGRLADMAKSA